MKKAALMVMFIAGFCFFLGSVTSTFAQKAPTSPTSFKSCNTCHKEGKAKYEEYKTFLKTNHSHAGTIPATTTKFTKPAVNDGCKTCHVDKFKNLPNTFKPTDIACIDCHNTSSTVHPISEKVKHPSK